MTKQEQIEKAFAARQKAEAALRRIQARLHRGAVDMQKTRAAWEKANEELWAAHDLPDDEEKKQP